MNAEDERVSILLVDDQPENLVALEAMLEGLGQNILKAMSGREALRHLLTHECALIILDVLMPNLDGFETARLIRERESTRQTPIIFLTAGDWSDAHVFRGYSVGAVDYIHKPFVPEFLRSKASVFVELAKKTELVKQQRRYLEQKNRELEEARARAELESQFKSRFLARMSHELRTPLNSILGFSEVLEQELFGPLSPKQKDYLACVLQSGRHLLELVNDILDLAKVESGHLQLDKAWTTVDAIVRPVETIVTPMAQKQGVTLQTDLPAELPRIHIDPLRMREVLQNLLSNAIKFTPGGGRVSLKARANGGHVDLVIDDTGIGISAEDLPRLFHEFERISPRSGNLLKHPDGTGLGLVISHRLVELHGGNLSVESEEGRGTRVTVSLPVESVATPTGDNGASRARGAAP
jgi:signal transduction histidine kinase